MLTLTLTLNPDLDSDIAEARAVLDRLSAARAEAIHDPAVIREKVVALLRGYGEKRTEYIRQVAQASPGSASQEDLIAVIGSAKAIGGTHSAIERAWRAKGMTTTFISTDAVGNAVMDLDLADIVLSVLHDQVDEPDPLSSARF
ncbi:hypothetical protein [Actinoplanes friuliensis]|jgi:hypothetical protein|uniref:Uncharacterized protein n=1 Tax=Actinoplanes friuliensis DSM 7358 TaxID=1246995 RepID=U5VTZ9_9ACTN|nr:hypothetical protein [Actinoplanes friuliensis]AGZ40473.1 hypothetical protein AFR_10920 [Actinoplanes friuliensis DSM 7358]